MTDVCSRWLYCTELDISYITLETLKAIWFDNDPDLKDSITVHAFAAFKMCMTILYKPKMGSAWFVNQNHYQSNWSSSALALISISWLRHSHTYIVLSTSALWCSTFVKCRSLMTSQNCLQHPTTSSSTSRQKYRNYANYTNAHTPYV